MFKKLQYAKKESREKVLFSSKKELDEHLRSDIVYAVIENNIFTVHKCGGSYDLKDTGSFTVATLEFDDLIDNYNLVIIDPQDIINLAKEL